MKETASLSLFNDVFTTMINLVYLTVIMARKCQTDFSSETMVLEQKPFFGHVSHKRYFICYLYIYQTSVKQIQKVCFDKRNLPLRVLLNEHLCDQVVDLSQCDDILKSPAKKKSVLNNY